jgi:hypothetical protein
MARGLAEFKALDGFMNLFGAGQLSLTGRGLKVRSSATSTISITAGTE